VSFETIVYEMKDGVAKLHQEFGEARHRPAVSGNAQGARSKGFEKVLAVCRRERRTVVLEHEARLALEQAGVKTAASALVAADADEAVTAFKTLGSVPVAMKVVSVDIIHKTDAGGVKLNRSRNTTVASQIRKAITSAAAIK